MATFPRGHHARTCHQHNQRELRIGSVATTQPDAKVRWWVNDPTDALALRGIPCTGHGIGRGAMKNTRPDTLNHDRDKAA